jgi:hypothetical protein
MAMTEQRINDSMLFLRLPKPLLLSLTGAADRAGLSRSELVRRILVAGTPIAAKAPVNTRVTLSPWERR